MLDIKRVLAAKPKKPEDVELKELLTPWGERILEGEAPENPEVGTISLHPHPQFARDRWQSLDGWWECAFVSGGGPQTWRTAKQPDNFQGRIRVPFTPETVLSGVGRQLKPNELLWYRRQFAIFPLAPDERCILHFEAVDYACSCLVNGVRVGEHMGCYLPFTFDITDVLKPGQNELVLCVWDPSDTGSQLRGKQRLARGGIWYTAQGGIWQTVWLEVVPAAHIASIEMDMRADEGLLKLNVQVDGPVGELPAPVLSARLLDAAGGETARATARPSAGSSAVLALKPERPHLWSPGDPYLYRLELSLGADTVHSYAAFRSVGIERDASGAPRFCVNHEPVFLRGLLDQGYWSDGLMTPPCDDALAFDVQLARSQGFNLLRKHIKVECDRWYYHCDRLGMLVMQDMPSGGTAPYSDWYTSYLPTLFQASWDRLPDGAPRWRRALAAEDATYRNEWTQTCKDTIAYLRNHPCIIAWCLFNEGWGQFDARAADALVRSLDPTRPVDAVSGWFDQRCGDFCSHHNYFRPLEVPRDRARPPRAAFISEFGGISCAAPGHRALETSYGYDEAEGAAAFRRELDTLLSQVDALEPQGLCGFVYTQLSDVEEETNGIVTFDRRVVKGA